MSSVQRVPRPTTGVCHFTLETMGCEDATDRLYKNKAILAPMVRAVSTNKRSPIPVFAYDSSLGFNMFEFIAIHQFRRAGNLYLIS